MTTLHPSFRAGVPDWWESALTQAGEELGITCACAECPDCRAVNALAMQIHDRGPAGPEDFGEPEDRGDR